MPKCGLTEEQRSARPWGLPKAELERAKTITDPIHGDVYISKLELRLLDSAPMQRLRQVRQLGTTHLVYPTATHTRFSHSLGALRAAQDILDAIFDDTRPSWEPNTPTLFSEWIRDHEPQDFHRRIAEATVLARLGALLHDMCHVPFGHTIEDDLQILDRHDENVVRFDSLWGELDNGIPDLIEPSLLKALKPLILSHTCPDYANAAGPDDRQVGPIFVHPYPFVADIVGNTICADLIDYLQRDHYFTGLPAQFGRRFLEGFYVTSANHNYFPERLVMRISRSGHVRTDVVSELFKFLRYRYELTERVLVHHAKVAADAMIGKMLDMWSDAIWLDIAKSEKDKLEDRPYPDISEAKSTVDEGTQKIINAAVKTRLEADFTHFGDDGLLQHIAHQAKVADKSDRRTQAMATLAADVLNRRLFKRIGSFDSRENADEVWGVFGPAEQRRRIEQGAAKYAELDHSWYVLLWIPKPDMKLKAAEVLVDDRGTISRLSERDHAAHDRGREIYEAHKALWSISVYVHPSISTDQQVCRVIMAYIAEELGLIWTQGGESVTLLHLAHQQAVASLHSAPSDSPNWDEASYHEIAARDGESTFTDLVNTIRHSVPPHDEQGEMDLWGDRQP